MPRTLLFSDCIVRTSVEVDEYIALVLGSSDSNGWDELGLIGPSSVGGCMVC